MSKQINRIGIKPIGRTSTLPINGTARNRFLILLEDQNYPLKDFHEVRPIEYHIQRYDYPIEWRTHGLLAG